MVVRQNVLEACARAAHEAARSQRIAVGGNAGEHWEMSPTWLRDVAVHDAARVISGTLHEPNGYRGQLFIDVVRAVADAMGIRVV